MKRLRVPSTGTVLKSLALLLRTYRECLTSDRHPELASLKAPLAGYTNERHRLRSFSDIRALDIRIMRAVVECELSTCILGGQ